MTPALVREPSSRAFRRNLLLIWLLLSAILIAVAWTSIISRDMPDPDDHMRLQQVRDLLAGQGWFDTHQYRMNPPAGAPMHWSRLVDLPLVSLLLPLRALIGNDLAEIITLSVVPLIPLGFAIWLIGHLARRFVGEIYGLVAAAVVPAFTSVWTQVQPLRIDHHGWQLVLGVAAASAAFLPQPRRSGVIAGAAMALWLAISIEGLPFAAAIGSLFALRWLARGEEGDRLAAYLWTLAGASGLAFAATFAPDAWLGVHCDALTFPYLAAFAAAAVGVAGAHRLALGRFGRGVALGAIAGLAVAAIGVTAPVCLNGPFGTLDPMLREYWYLRVAEGLPLWRQTPTVIGLVIGYPLVGLAGASWAYAKAADEDRRDWASLIYISAGAIAVAVMVQRGGALANILALPGGMYLLRRSLPAVRAIANMPIRLIATVAAVLLLSPWASPMMAKLLEPELSPTEKARVALGEATRDCSSAANLAKLNVLPPSNLLTPLDVAPAMLTSTHHRLVASGHHRNHAAMKDVILAFTGSESRAREIIDARRIDYVVLCPYQNEPILFRQTAPDGFWARVHRGAAPPWLEPVGIGDAETLLVFRVKR